MTRIVNGKVVTEEEYWKSMTSGPFGFIVAFLRHIYLFLKLFVSSILDPQSLTNSYRRDGKGPGGDDGPRKPPVIKRITPLANCQAGS